MYSCDKIKEILDVEMRFILKHIDDHKWYNHIEDTEKAIWDFANKYAWIMREVFCDNLCSNKGCSSHPNKIFLNNISDGELIELIQSFHGEQIVPEISKIELKIIKQHIDMHKWFQGIELYDEAVRDFLTKFGWVISEMLRLRIE